MFPEHQVAYNDGEIIIACNSATIPTWKKDGVVMPNHSWLRRNGEILPLRSWLRKTISLRNIWWSDAGKYTCIGTNKNGKRFEAYSEVLVAGKLYL